MSATDAAPAAPDPIALLAQARAHAARVRAWTRRGDQDAALRWLGTALACLEAVEAAGLPSWAQPGMVLVRAELDAALAIEADTCTA